jgi:hypothetical protein
MAPSLVALDSDVPFPPGQDGATAMSVSGVLHFAFGGTGFIAFAVAAFLFGGWLARHGERGRAAWSRVAGAVILVGFVGGPHSAQPG